MIRAAITAQTVRNFDIFRRHFRVFSFEDDTLKRTANWIAAFRDQIHLFEISCVMDKAISPAKPWNRPKNETV